MTQQLSQRNGIEQQQISPYRMDRVRDETLESLKYRSGGGKAQLQMIEVIFHYFADQYDLLDAIDTEVPDGNGGFIDILVQCSHPIFSAPVLIAVEVDGPDHLQKDKYRRQTIQDSNRFINRVIYPFHITNKEANRRPKQALRRLIHYINNVFWILYCARYEHWLSTEPDEPEFLHVPELEPPKNTNGSTGTLPVSTNGHTTDEEEEDEDVPF